LFDGFALMSYASAIEPLRAANLLADRAVYELRLLPAVGAVATSSSGATVRATTHIGERMDYDLVLVVAGGDPMQVSSRGVFEWLRQLDKLGVALGGVSGGPVVLAKAGVMSGRRMTVHWEHAHALAAEHPDLLIERSLFIVDRNRMTCAGGAASLDMMHALLTEQHGLDFARKVSDWFLHTDIRPAGGPQRAGLAERYQTHQPALLQAIASMENHVADPLELDQIARLSGVGVRQLNRLFHDKLGQSTIAFYRDLRLTKAHTLLMHSTLSIVDVAEATGFGNAAHFSRSYSARFGIAPSHVRKLPREDMEAMAVHPTHPKVSVYNTDTDL